MEIPSQTFRRISDPMILIDMALAGMEEMYTLTRCLSSAISIGHVDRVKSLLSEGVPCDGHSFGSWFSTPPLITSVFSGNADIVRAILEAGVHVHIRHDGDTALGIAASQGKLDIVCQLLDYGAKANMTGTSGYSPLMLAARMGYSKIMARLISAGASVHIRGCTISNRNILVTYLSSLRPEPEIGIIKQLLEKRVDVNEADEDGKIALFYAVDLHQPFRNEVILFLLQHGADPHVTDKLGCTPESKLARRIGLSKILPSTLQRRAVGTFHDEEYSHTHAPCMLPAAPLPHSEKYCSRLCHWVVKRTDRSLPVWMPDRLTSSIEQFAQFYDET